MGWSLPSIKYNGRRISTRRYISHLSLKMQPIDVFYVVQKGRLTDFSGSNCVKSSVGKKEEVAKLIVPPPFPFSRKEREDRKLILAVVWLIKKPDQTFHIFTASKSGGNDLNEVRKKKSKDFEAQKLWNVRSRGSLFCGTAAAVFK